jgi:hypothetical protein
MSADTALMELLARHPEPARPRVIGIAATHPRALARMCACTEGCREEVYAGRTSTGAHCKAHLADQLEVA